MANFVRALELDGSLVEARVQAASIYMQRKQEYSRVAAAPNLALRNSSC